MTTAEHRQKASVSTAADDMSKAIRLAQKGDANAFRLLYMAHSPRVYRVFLQVADNPAEAADLTSQVFLRLFGEIHSYREELNLSTQLHRLTLESLLKQLRQKRTGPNSEARVPSPNDPALVTG
jgi:DNA-directed RNA polymerase specialized sigma24 family protein